MLEFSRFDDNILPYGNIPYDYKYQKNQTECLVVPVRHHDQFLKRI